MSLSGEELYRKILDLRSPAPDKRMKSIALIPVIVERLGPVRSTSEFFPYLLETTNYTSDMLRTILSTIENLNISSFSSSQVEQLLSTLISEITVYETPSLHKELASCVASIYSKQKSQILIQQVQSVLQSEWLSEQVYAYSLIARLVPIVDDESRSELLSTLFKHAKNSSPMSLIRRSAISVFSEILNNVKENVHADQMIEIVQSFTDDESPTIGCDIPQFLSAFLKAGGDITAVNEVYENLLQSTVWRVQLFAVMNMAEIYKNASDRTHLIEFLNVAAKDNEEEIRIAACKQLPLVLDLTGSEDLCNLFMNDKSEKVRLVFVDAVSKHPDQEFVATALMTMLHDENSAVVLAAINALNERHFDSKLLDKGIVEFLKNCKNYRGRRAVVQAIPGLDIECGTELVEMLVTDESIAVRYAMIDVLTRITFTDEYKSIVGRMFKSDDYQIRQTAIVLVSRLNLWDSFEDDISTVLHDPVSNVRLTLAKRLPRTAQTLLGQLRQDKDSDVRDVAAENK